MAAENSNSCSYLSGKWTNEKCIEIAFAEQFPSAVKDINIQKDIIVRYFNFYLGGKLKHGLKVTDLTFAVIAIMPKHEETETFIWESAHYKEDGTLFCLTPEDKLRAETGNGISDEMNQDNLNIETEKTIQTQDENAFFKEMAMDINEINLNTDKTSQTQEKRSDTNLNAVRDSVSNSLTDEKKQDNILQNGKPTSNPGTSRDKDDAEKETNPPYTYADFYTVPEFPSNLQWFSRWPDKKVLEEDPPQYGATENAAFIASCNKLLEKWNTNSKGRIILKYLFGIIALVTMRTTTKKFTHLSNTFRSKKFLTYISFADNYVQYSIPHRRFVKHSFRTFRKRDGKIPLMFVKIVVNSFHIDALRRSQPKGSLPKLNVFKLTVLSHTADYGFGLVTMLQNIETKIGAKGVVAVLNATFCDKTAKSWTKLLKFLKKYMVNNSKQATHHWARVINTKFFEDLTCANNYALSVILGVFVQQLTNDANIWQSAWVVQHPEHIQELKELGYRMFKDMRSTVDLNTLEKENERRKSDKAKRPTFKLSAKSF